MLLTEGEVKLTYYKNGNLFNGEEVTFAQLVEQAKDIERKAERIKQLLEDNLEQFRKGYRKARENKYVSELGFEI
jgi:hypothetical protein